MKFILFFLVPFALHSSAQKFPDAFVGKWKGDLSWYQSGKPMQSVKMQLSILPDSGIDQYTWHLQYGDAGTDHRPYTLKPVDKSKGHWRIDENNGILLDQYWLGDKFHSAFTTGNSTIINTCFIEDGKLIVEFISITSKPIATTGKGTEEVPAVDSYFVKSYQRAVLSKKRKNLK